ncbi:efflux RND transporter permease subunit [Pajaroellobacter abortibovis]|uniref:Membrane transport protein MMPL domain-containing protein n=1 Tax=Pajaroellobacter abortibovis TaxID=1882918 RepID=A0A1L6MUY3_9BACT|nr:MMPL family transporter [Pajaroellobacter abortibovis]APR99265.1 hypothetical protein BCY86_00185 [Pajaroellobacter abortibovis]
MWKRMVGKLVDFASNRPFLILLIASCLMGTSTWYARKLELKTDFLELLPRNSPSFMAYEHQLGRVGGGGTLLTVVESPDSKANARLIEDLSSALTDRMQTWDSCVAACSDDTCRLSQCGPRLISYFEKGTHAIKQFYEQNKWLYPSLSELEELDADIEYQIALHTGLVEHTEEEGEKQGAQSSDSLSEQVKRYRTRWEQKARQYNQFPQGYFSSPDGTRYVLVIVSESSGTGDAIGDRLIQEVSELVEKLHPKLYHPDMQVGYGGDLPNARAEKQSIENDVIWATLIPMLLIMGGLVFYFRSIWSLAILGVPAALGISCAYAYATAVYGYVNTAGAFLGAVILGNGVNYPIVLLARYVDFRARGQAPREALREAVFNAFRAELVGACVASIAYGSLSITQFRGFSQFGVIGFLGMLFVWMAIIPVVPALIVIQEKWQQFWQTRKAATALAFPQASYRGQVGWFVRWTMITLKRPVLCLTLAFLFTAIIVYKLPSYLRDPWEYDFSRLGSSSTHRTGPQVWSSKADQVFNRSLSVSGARLLADFPEQVPLLKAQILKNVEEDALFQRSLGYTDPPLIRNVITIDDFLPGSAEEQQQKQELWKRIRSRLTPAIMTQLSQEDRLQVEELLPPDHLHLLGPRDLPIQIQRKFMENNGVLGTLMYLQPREELNLQDGKIQLRISQIADNITLPDGTLVKTASRSTVFAEMLNSMHRDGPLASGVAFVAVLVVVILATRSVRGIISISLALFLGVVWMLGLTAWFNQKLNFLNFIALPITFGIGSEYPFNIFDRSRLLKGNIQEALERSAGAVALCSYTTTIGYGSLLVSDQQALQSFGRLAVMGEITCLLTALFVLPAFLQWRSKKSVKG